MTINEVLSITRPVLAFSPATSAHGAADVAALRRFCLKYDVDWFTESDMDSVIGEERSRPTEL